MHEHYAHLVWQAVARDDHLSLERLLSGYEPAAYRDENFGGLLHLSARFGNACMTGYFLEMGCDVEQRAAHEETPLICLARYCRQSPGRTAVLKMLLKAGANPLAKDCNRSTAIGIFIEREDLECLGIVLEHTGFESLEQLIKYLMFMNVGPESLSLLLNGVSTNEYRDADNLSLLHRAALCGNARLVAHYVKVGCDVNEVAGSDFETPLVLAARCERSRTRHMVLRLLLKAGASVTKTDANGKTALHHCCGRPGDDVRSAWLLLKAGADVNCLCIHKCTPLHYAVSVGNVMITRLLLNYGANVRLQDEMRGTPMHMAVCCLHSLYSDTNRFYELLKLLLEHGGNVNSENEWGKTPFDLLLKLGDGRAVELFLEHGADLDRPDRKGQLPLHLAAKNSNPIVSYLILSRRPKHANLRTAQGLTAAHIAASRAHLDVLEVLHEYGADMNARDADGNTPLLYILCDQSHLYELQELRAVVELLFRLGANGNARNNRDDSVLGASLDLDTDLELDATVLSQILLSGQQLDREQNGIVDSDRWLSEFANECRQELELARQAKFYGAFSLFDVLVKDKRKLEAWARNRELVDAFLESDWESQYPIYGWFAWQRLDQACAQLERRRGAANTLKCLAPPGVLCDVVIDKILDNLTKFDLLKMCDS